MSVFMKYSGKFFKSIDIYGQKIELNFQKQTSFKTIFGGILTCFILFLLVLGCWFYGKELIEKQKPSVITSQRSVATPKRIDIQKDNLIITIGISDGQSQIYRDSTIFQLRAVQETIGYYNDTSGKQKKKTISNELKLKPCTIDDIGIPSLVDYFEALDLSQNYCFDSSSEVYMEGDFDAERFSVLYVYAEKCKNSTNSDIICKSPEVINQKLAQSKIKVSLSDNVIDPLNFKNPFTYKGISLFSQTSSSFPKEVQLFFTNQYIESDVGFLYEQIETINSYIFTDMKETNYFNDPNILVRLQLRVQKQRENLMQRRYQRFADIVAQIGGLLKILTTLGGLLCYPFTRLHLFKSIVDQVFQFECNEKISFSVQNEVLSSQEKSPNYSIQKNSVCKTDKKKQQDSFNQKLEKNYKKSKKELNHTKNNMETFIEQSHFGNKLLETNYKDIKTELSNQSIKGKDNLIEKTKDYFQSSHKIIKYTFINIFSHIFLPKLKHIRQQRDLVEKGISKINGHLDVLFILNKLLEVDKIKSILLNQDQLKLFEYIPKPVISIENQLNDSDQGQSDKNQYINDLNNQNQLQNPSVKEEKLQTINYVKQVYSIYKKDKSHSQKGFDACQGLINILNKNKLTKIDESLIKIIDPDIINKFERINNEEKFKQDEISFLNSYLDEKNNINNSTTIREQTEGILREKVKSFNSTKVINRISQISLQKHPNSPSDKQRYIDKQNDKIKTIDQIQIQQPQLKINNEQSKQLKSQTSTNTTLVNKNEQVNEKVDSDKQSISINEQPVYFVQQEHNQYQRNKIYIFQDKITKLQLCSQSIAQQLSTAQHQSTTQHQLTNQLYSTVQHQSTAQYQSTVQNQSTDQHQSTDQQLLTAQHQSNIQHQLSAQHQQSILHSSTVQHQPTDQHQSPVLDQSPIQDEQYLDKVSFITFEDKQQSQNIIRQSQNKNYQE